LASQGPTGEIQPPHSGQRPGERADENNVVPKKTCSMLNKVARMSTDGKNADENHRHRACGWRNCSGAGGVTAPTIHHLPPRPNALGGSQMPASRYRRVEWFALRIAAWAATFGVSRGECEPELSFLSHSGGTRYVDLLHHYSTWRRRRSVRATSLSRARDAPHPGKRRDAPGVVMTGSVFASLLP
jgi:hypothetical protein